MTVVGHSTIYVSPRKNGERKIRTSEDSRLEEEGI